MAFIEGEEGVNGCDVMMIRRASYRLAAILYRRGEPEEGLAVMQACASAAVACPYEVQG